MDIVITLPEDLWNEICAGNKEYECRKRIPRNFFRDTDKCFVIIKGTTNVVGWFNICQFLSCVYVDEIKEKYLNKLSISKEWFDKYSKREDVLHLWEIDSVVYLFSMPQNRDSFLGLDFNPQSYAYCHPKYTEYQTVFRRGKAFKED